MVVAAAAAAAVVVVVVVVRGGKLAFGIFGAQTFSTLGQAFGVARVYWACRPRAAWGRHACVGRVSKLGGKVCVLDLKNLAV